MRPLSSEVEDALRERGWTPERSVPEQVAALRAGSARVILAGAKPRTTPPCPGVGMF